MLNFKLLHFILFLLISFLSFKKKKKKEKEKKSYLFLKCTLRKFHSFCSGFELGTLSHSVAEQYSHLGGIFREREAEHLELVGLLVNTGSWKDFFLYLRWCVVENVKTLTHGEMELM